jgi:hypothetical protein
VSHHRILGIYADPTQAAQAIAAVQKEDLGQVVAYCPVQNHAIERVLPAEVSRVVSLFMLVGGLLGCFSGFALPIYTSLKWGLISGGKPVVAIPAFTVIAFELAILFAALGGVAGFLIQAGLPRVRGTAPYDERFTVDRYGVLVTCTQEHCEGVTAVLERSGAEEVRQ